MGVRQDIPNSAEVLADSADHDDIGRTRGFVVQTTGVAAVRFREDSAVILMPAVAGVYYEANLIQVEADNGSHTAGSVTVFRHV